MADLELESILEEIRNEVSDKRKDAELPFFEKGRNRKFAAEEFERDRLQDSLAQSWNMAYVEMEVAPSLSSLKRKIKSIVAKAVGICVIPLCRKQSLYNLNNTETVHLLYAYIEKLEEESRKQAERIGRLEEQMQEILK